MAVESSEVRVRLDLAYDGTEFSGWAAQPGLRTVEGVLAEALGTVLRLPAPRLTVAGRTDAGVHARGQVAHVDLPGPVWRALPGRSDGPPEEALTRRLGGVLPGDVVVHRCEATGEGFDARFSALSRRYSYRLVETAAEVDPLRRRDTVVAGHPLDPAAMTAAGRRLLGLRDFAAYCRRREGASTVRTLLECSWERDADGVVVGTVVADAFCHSMVRALVGALVPVGAGRVDVSWPEEVLSAGRRDPRVKVMAAHGLCLEEVRYPDRTAYATRAEEARARRDG